jgi:hypothetical protein
MPNNPYEVLQSNPWKEAVIEQIMLTEGAPPNIDDPIDAIKYLIDYHVQLERDFDTSEFFMGDDNDF